MANGEPTLTYKAALVEAQGLQCEAGENSEYDRALMELLHWGYGVPKEQVAKDMGVTLQYLYADPGKLGHRNTPNPNL